MTLLSLRPGLGRLLFGLASFGCGLHPATDAGADSYVRQPVDVRHYDVAIAFLDGFAYQARVRLDVRLETDAVSELRLDFDGPTFDRVSAHGEPLGARADGRQLVIDLGGARAKGEIVPVLVEYHGWPDGHGLRAGSNAHGHGTLFADNWPENARHWLPSIDHPSDKATVDFAVTAADRYEVVGPGRLVERRSLHDGRRTTRWSEAVPIATYCMVLGVAEFQVNELGAVDGVPISAWIFPEDAAVAARTLARSGLVLERFSDLVGPFPYEKLAHVQSSTTWGAVEYASAVFYSEKTFQGKEAGDGVVAHELAHQWWGDSVTPADWDDVWLSEGFATYFHGLFAETTGGAAALREHMARAAAGVRAAIAKKPTPIVDPSVTDPAAKLGPIAYQKGAWVLHMLRHRLGDTAFFAGLRVFYLDHAGGTATSLELRHALEATSAQPLARFFREWLLRSDLPDVRASWRWDAALRSAVVDLQQLQPGEPYELDVDMALRTKNGVETRTVRLTDRRVSARIPLSAPAEGVELDPDGWLLLAAPGLPHP